MSSSPPGALVEHFFRHEYGRVVAVLVRRVGARHLEAIEDSVQGALMSALTVWAAKGIPDNPSAWVQRVAYNELLDVLRKDHRRRRIRGTIAPEETHELPAPTFDDEVGDELLRMLFVCCDPRIPRESRLVLALKTLCGFSVSEIAFRLFTSEANVYKRLGRARDRLREGVSTETPRLPELRKRLPEVRSVIYVLFNEGYLSTHAERTIRVELCDEAIRLGGLLAEHPVGAEPASFALMALMHLHRARLGARCDASGGLLLLEEQDRAAWDDEHKAAGATFLERAATGDALSRFHIEAAIAAEHCFADSFEATRWERIAELYKMLERTSPSPIHSLNRAVATAQARGPDEGLAVLDGVTPPTWLEGHYLWAAVLADLHLRAGHMKVAGRLREQALEGAPSERIRDVLERRLTW